jgi:isopentenyl-diphosphate delta-isomerase
MTLVQLVDEQDRPLGTAEKLAAHQQGLLHRAVSVVVWGAGGQMLLQQRALGKYHCGGLWANACCSHPLPGEAPAAAAARRLAQELGLSLVVQPAGTLLYRAEVGGGLVEHELDHIFTALAPGATPRPNPAEVMHTRWAHPQAIATELAQRPQRFAPWFPLVFRHVWPG